MLKKSKIDTNSIISNIKKETIKMEKSCTKIFNKLYNEKRNDQAGEMIEIVQFLKWQVGELSVIEPYTKDGWNDIDNYVIDYRFVVAKFKDGSLVEMRLREDGWEKRCGEVVPFCRCPTIFGKKFCPEHDPIKFITLPE